MLRQLLNMVGDGSLWRLQWHCALAICSSYHLMSWFNSILESSHNNHGEFGKLSKFVSIASCLSLADHLFWCNLYTACCWNRRLGFAVRVRLPEGFAGNSHKWQKLQALSASGISYSGTAKRLKCSCCSLNFIWGFIVKWLVFSVHKQNFIQWYSTPI